MSMAESYFGTHLCKLITCLCWPLFQERSVVNLGFAVSSNGHRCLIWASKVTQHIAHTSIYTLHLPQHILVQCHYIIP